MLKILTGLLLAISVTVHADDKCFTQINTSNNVQGIASDNHGTIYTLEREKSNAPSKIYSNDGVSRELILTDSGIGHQGFAVQKSDKDNSLSIWTGSKSKPGDVILFSYQKGSVISRQYITLFDTTFFKRNETMPTVSANQRYLIVRGRKSSREMVIRVYDIRKLLSASHKIINNFGDYEYQWSLPEKYLTDNNGSLTPLQAMASDGKVIFFLFGNSKINEKSLVKFTMDGKFIKKEDIITGQKQALSEGKGTFYEPEGIIYQRDSQKLKALIVSGSGKDKTNRVYCLP